MPIDITGLVTANMKFEQERMAKHAEITAGFAKATSSATVGYPDAEQISWPQQYAEAQAWQANNAAPTPILDAIAQGRGIDRVTLIQKALAMQVAMQQMAPLIGLRQKLRDEIDAVAVGDTAALELIKWPA